MNPLRQFWHAADKLFDLPRRLRAVRDRRTDPPISAGVLTTSLFLGAVLRVPSFLQLQAETGRPGWQRLTGRSKPISDDAFGYGLERARLDDLRDLLVVVNQTLKRNKAFAAAKIHGLLVVALDANEQFKSRSRCCTACCQRQVKVTDPAGQVIEVTEYYHRQVYAQLHGPHLSTLLDLEPIRPGEDEAAAALRLLGRMRRRYPDLADWRVKTIIFSRRPHGKPSASRGRFAKRLVVQTHPLPGPDFFSMIPRHYVSALFKTSQRWQGASSIGVSWKIVGCLTSASSSATFFTWANSTACRNPPGARPSISSARTRTRRARSRSFLRSTPRPCAGVEEFPIVRVRLSQMALRRPRQWGARWLGCQRWEQLGLGGFWRDKLTPSREGTRWDQVLQTLALYRLIDPGKPVAAAPATRRKPWPSTAKSCFSEAYLRNPESAGSLSCHFSPQIQESTD